MEQAAEGKEGKEGKEVIFNSPPCTLPSSLCLSQYPN